MNNRLFVLAVAFGAVALAQSPLVITTPNALPVATVNQAYSAQLAASGGTAPYSWHFQLGGNPSPRFTISQNGLLSGTPTSADLGVLTIAVQVTDAAGVTVTKQFSFTVQTTQPLALTTTAFTPAVTGAAYSFQLAGSGGTPPYKWDVLPAIVTFPVPGQVAPGLTLDSATGLVTGTPTATGTFSFTITLTDGANGSVSKPFTLTISPGGPLGIVTASLPSGIVGAPYSQTLEVRGGIPPYRWAVTTGSLPRGLTLDAASGIISGAPLDAAITPFTVTVTDSAATPNSARQALSLTVVAPPALNISTTTLPGATQGAPYSQKIAASGGVPPYRWAISNGTLPVGLVLGETTGSIEGTPSVAGSSTFTVQLTDSAAGTPARTTVFLALTVARLTQVTLTSKSLDPGAVGTSYSGALQASGGATPYSWSVIAGSMPPGVLLGSSGIVSGVPTVAADFGFTAQVVDSAGGSAIGNVAFRVAPAALSLVPLTLPSAIAGTPYPPQILNAAGGFPPYTFSIQGALPAGLSLSNGVIAGTPSSTGTGSFTIRVTDAAQATATTSQQLVVRSSLPVDLVPSASSLAFTLSPGAADIPEPRHLTVASSDVNTRLDWQLVISPAAPWLSISGINTTAVQTLSTPGGFTVSLTPQALTLAASATPYSTTLSLNCVSPSPCAGNSQRINVSLTVSAPAPQLTVTASFVALTAASASAPARGVFGIRNSGGGSITVNSVASSDSWLTVEGAPSTLSPGLPVYLTVNANPTGLTPGQLYRGTISVNTSAGSARVPVTLLVPSSLNMTLNPAGQQFQMSAGGSVGNREGTAQILISGGTTASWTASTLPGTSWLTVRTPTGTSTPTAPGALNYAIDPVVSAALTAGTYYGRIRVTSAQSTNGPLDLLVVLNIAPGGTAPDPEFQPAGLVFVSGGGGTTSSQNLTLYASSVSPVPYQASASTATGAAWLSVSPLVGTASASVPGRPIVTVNPAGLAPGVYRGVVTYQFSPASIRSVNVTYIVPSLTGGGLPFFQAEGAEAFLQPRATCTATKVVATATGLPTNFAQPASWPTPLAVTLSDDCGTSLANGTVDVVFSNGEPPVGLSPDSAVPGRYAATWTPRNAASQVTITAFASAPGLASARTQISGRVTPNVAPALTPGGMLNVFNPSPGGGIAPGMAVQIYGSNLALPGVSEVGTSLPFPTTLSGTSVLIGGKQAPLYYVSPGQINALTPFELQPGVPYQVLVTVNGAITTPDRFTLAAGAPGIAAFANGNIIAQHVNGTLVTETAPVKPSEIFVLYLAGLGSAENQPATGSGSPPPPTAPLNPITLAINGKPAPTLFVGLTPGSVGLYQINLAVPEDTPDGNQTLTVTQAGVASNVTILPVRR